MQKWSFQVLTMQDLERLKMQWSRGQINRNLVNSRKNEEDQRLTSVKKGRGQEIKKFLT